MCLIVAVYMLDIRLAHELTKICRLALRMSVTSIADSTEALPNLRVVTVAVMMEKNLGQEDRAV